MVVRNYIAKFNDNNCINIMCYMAHGLSVTEAFMKVVKKNRHNPKLIKGFEKRNDKYFWIFALLEDELQDQDFCKAYEEQQIQNIQTC